MRKCLRCDKEMIEGYTIREESEAAMIQLVESEELLAKRIQPRVAVCPVCGEVSVYIENIERLQK